MKKLLLVAIISFLFMAGEIVGGYLSGSLAIITDAAH
jgi:Co/Zn/Cd efflux system component